MEILIKFSCQPTAHATVQAESLKIRKMSSLYEKKSKLGILWILPPCLSWSLAKCKGRKMSFLFLKLITVTLVVVAGVGK